MPFFAQIFPGPSLDDSALVRRISESVDAHSFQYQTALAKGYYVDHQGRKNTVIQNCLPVNVVSSLSKESNMIQDLALPMGAEQDPSLPAGLTLINVGLTMKPEINRAYQALLYVSMIVPR